MQLHALQHDCTLVHTHAGSCTCVHALACNLLLLHNCVLLHAPERICIRLQACACSCTLSHTTTPCKTPSLRPLSPPPRQVNNRSFPLPVALHGARVRVSRHGTGLLLETDFSLRVAYDWQGATNITVPSTFPKSICGICSDAGGDAGSSNSTEAFCGRLARGELFGVCQGVVDPWGYLEGCMGEPCSNSSACQALASYAAACKERGVQLPDWRRAEGCGEWGAGG